MLKQERLEKMKIYVREKNVVTTSDLCDRFSISINTARNDINALVSAGVCTKIYGGISAVKKKGFQAFDIRGQDEIDAKKAIARAAAAYVEDGDAIFIDTGTTTMHMVDYLKAKDLTIITNNLAVVNKVANMKAINLICCGEIYERSNNSFYMEDAENYCCRYNIQKIFLSAVGISLAGDITNALLHEYKNKQSLIRNCSQCFLLADSSKIGKTALYTFANLSQVDVLITNRPLTEALQSRCDADGTAVRIAQADQE